MLRLSRAADWRAAGAVVAAALLTACGATSAPDVVQQTAKPVASWAATGAMAAGEWANRHVPTSYARMTLRTASQAVRRDRAQLAAAPGRDASTAEALARYDRVSHYLDALAAAIDAGARDSVVKLLSAARP